MATPQHGKDSFGAGWFALWGLVSQSTGWKYNAGLMWALVTLNILTQLVQALGRRLL